MKPQLSNIHIQKFEPLESPEQLIAKTPITPAATRTVQTGRSEIRAALIGEDPRPLVIIGPCSIHDHQAALDYARRLAALRERLAGQLIIVMRVYFEKPRTSIGWKGLINDPNLDGTYDIVGGLKMARRILLQINELGLPCATEFLDPIVPQYTADLVSWSAIGARTTQSQTHRQMASGLSMPVGFKNATDGSLDVAINAMISAHNPHAFVGIDMQGRTSIVNTAGNPDLHLVLRGGGIRPNFARADVAYTKVRIEETFSDPSHHRVILIDCSHGNSDKDYRKQPKVFQVVLEQILAGEKAILGFMVESNLEAGSQDPGAEKLVYGQSITDGCIDWETTEELLAQAHALLQKKCTHVK